MKIKMLNRKSLMAVCSIVVILSVLSTIWINPLPVSASTVWDGTVAPAFADGDGSEGDPYQIATAEQMARLGDWAYTWSYGDLWGQYFVLTADIALNDISDDNWTDTAIPWTYGSWTNSTDWWCFFSGNFDGRGHVISGLYIESSMEYNGLFAGIVGNSVIKNLGIVNSYIGGINYNGAIAGTRFWGDTDTLRIENCFSDNTVTVNGWYNGGIIGLAYGNMTIKDCFSSADLGNLENAPSGGIVGVEWGSTNLNFINCYNTQPGKSMLGTNTGNAETYTGCYTTGTGATGATELTVLQMTGAAAKTNMSAFDFDTVWYTKTGGTPALRAFWVEDVDDLFGYVTEYLLKKSVTGDFDVVEYFAPKAVDIVLLLELKAEILK